MYQKVSNINEDARKNKHKAFGYCQNMSIRVKTYQKQLRVKTRQKVSKRFNMYRNVSRHTEIIHFVKCSVSTRAAK